ncbi:hypothetical protein BGZ65_001773 [Modicella reniformis]|uniref:Uncharacterized protein n=1 Tax=Modicella reniformis TaxID=1440133 RepID=A0A9P6M9Z1_9FUNG|nr:hypothetical protein BGZ65_001773 [Modicella reniformis]
MPSREQDQQDLTCGPSTRRRLPPECIDLIVQYLWDDISTLHSILLCSKDMFSLAVPILYRNPFRLINEHRSWTRLYKTKRTVHLMRILHTCALKKPNQQELEQAGEWVTSSPHTVPQPSSSSLSPAKAAIKPLEAIDAKLPVLPTSLTVDYLFHYTHQAQIPKVFRAFQLMNPNARKIYEGYKNRAACERELSEASTNLNLTCYGHFPSRIQVLSMTPSQLAYIMYKYNRNLNERTEDGGYWLKRGQGVEALKMLRRLELDLAAIYVSTQRLGPPTAAATAAAIVSENATALENDDGSTGEVVNLIDISLLFIQEHQRLFPTCPEDPDDDHSIHNTINKSYGGTLLQELVIRGTHPTWTPTHLLANIQPLKVLDLSSWNSNVPNMERIPSSRLKSFRINIARRLAFVEVQLPFLQQCTQLQEIWMPSQVADTFQWAIDLRRLIGRSEAEAEARLRRVRRRVGLGAEEGEGEGEGGAGGHEDQGQQQQQEEEDSPHIFDQTLVPKLRKVVLYGGPQELIPSLKDAAYAFCDTLEELTGYEDGYGRKDEYLRMAITWSIPHLTTLDLRGRYVFFFDLKSLRHCPGLVVVRLTIESNISSASMVNAVGWEYEHVDFSVFAELKRLEELQLLGTAWDIDDSALEILMGYQDPMGSSSSCFPSSPPTELQEQSQEQQEQGPHRSEEEDLQCYTSPLRNTLLHFGIAESHRPTRRGLTKFVKVMKQLQVLHLGTKYNYVTDSLLRAAGSRRLYVEINTSD